MPNLRFPPETLRQYALLADGERGALVSPRGDIAFLCAPRWHDDAVFSSLLGGPGRYAVTPTDRHHVWGGHYESGSLIWRNRWVSHALSHRVPRGTGIPRRPAEACPDPSPPGDQGGGQGARRARVSGRIRQPHDVARTEPRRRLAGEDGRTALPLERCSTRRGPVTEGCAPSSRSPRASTSTWFWRSRLVSCRRPSPTLRRPGKPRSGRGDGHAPTSACPSLPRSRSTPGRCCGA